MESSSKIIEVTECEVSFVSVEFVKRDAGITAVRVAVGGEEITVDT